MKPFKVLALDLEGTLVSNAMSVFPRPGLHYFLTEVDILFDRVILYTAVSTCRTREIMQTLANEGIIPRHFTDIEIVDWSGEQKDLTFIDNAEPTDCLLVDDIQAYIKPSQLKQWVPIVEFDYPYSDDDKELFGVLERLKVMQQK